MVGAVSVVTGAISRCEAVVGNLSGGGARSPVVLGFIRHRMGAGVEVVLKMKVRDLRVRLEDRRKGNVGGVIENKRFDAQSFV